MDIEDLLRWAYRDELPKEAAQSKLRGIGVVSSWGGVQRVGELMTLIDATENRWGVIPLGCEEDPHPDAVTIAEAVAGLDTIGITLPADYDPLQDLAGLDLGDEGAKLLAGTVGKAIDRTTTLLADGRTRVLRDSLAHLVRMRAILGQAPEWEAQAPEVVPVRGERGREIWWRRTTMVGAADGMTYEVETPDGYCPKRKRPVAGAYRKYVLEPDPLEAALARAEYEVWHAALAYLVADLDGRLVDHIATGPARVIRPWEGGEARAPRVLPDLDGERKRHEIIAEQRKEWRAHARRRKSA